MPILRIRKLGDASSTEPEAAQESDVNADSRLRGLENATISTHQSEANSIEVRAENAENSVGSGHFEVSSLSDTYTMMSLEEVKISENRTVGDRLIANHDSQSATLESKSNQYYETTVTEENLDTISTEEVEKAIDACSKGDTDTLQSYMARYTTKVLSEIRTPDRENRTLLHLAARQQQLEVIQLLLPAIVSCLTTPNGDGSLPLHEVACFGTAPMAKKMTKYMTEDQINTIDDREVSPLGVALLYNNDDVALFLAKHFRTKKQQSIIGTALLDLFMRTDKKTLQKFISVHKDDGSAFWEMKSIFNGGLLHLARRSDDVEMARVLFKAVAAAPIKYQKALLESEDIHGLAPLQYYAYHGCEGHINALLEAMKSSHHVGRMVNLNIGSVGTPYFLAKVLGNTGCQQALLKWGSNGNHASEFCGLSTGQWIRSIHGIEVPDKSNFWRKMRKSGIETTSIVFEAISDQQRQRQKQEREELLQKLTAIDYSTINSAPRPAIKYLYRLAYNYIIDIDRTALVKVPPERRQPCSSISGAKEGADLWAILIELTNRFECLPQFSISSIWICEGCRARIGFALVFLCTSCPGTMFCEDCSQRRLESSIPPESKSKCPGPRRHIWADIHMEKYNFRVDGNMFPSVTIGQYLNGLCDKAVKV